MQDAQSPQHLGNLVVGKGGQVVQIVELTPALKPQTAGQVDHRDVVLTRSEREANVKMMVCCSRAAGKKLVLAL